ncbi:unnamed protein product [Bemisia tabaci]|uniref:Uncharacterized protein n=1 Tax=Bemisia tabaci TaxID=7038 RepID=A0A9P0CEH8_BEMTA|nr:PREDICTED: protein GDAP2 homolog [Bemisia tabaci]CAH0774005.1 unnamed protein product [Bemisia tabaci]
MVMEGIISLTSLKPWSSTVPSQQHTAYSAKPLDTSPFPHNPDINDRIIFWEGDITTLQVDAIVHSACESMTVWSSMSNRLLGKAGFGLREELNNAVCHPGEVILTSGHNLPARAIIHTVGPTYNIRYQSAAQSTLHLCYRNVLQKAYDMNFSSIAISPINSVRLNFPPDEGAHIALRTIRRFLERQEECGRIVLKTVVIVTESVDTNIYEVLLPIYFPRSVEEEILARLQLTPDAIGGPAGEPIHPDRQIRIIDNPHHQLSEETTVVDLTDGGTFTQMQGDLDQQRLLGERPPLPTIDQCLVRDIHNKERYERLLRRAKTEDLSEVSGIGCLYRCGSDRLGRPVIVFVGKWFRFKEINLEKALLYLIYLLDPLVKGDYVIAYFHTMTSSANYPTFYWLKEVYNVLPYKYKKNLKSFYIVHPTFWTKMMTWWFTTFMAPAIKQKVVNLPGVEYLYSVISPNQLEIPAFITEYDMTINGIRYANQ